MWYSGQTIRDESGRVLYYDGALEDITERKRAEAAATELAAAASGLLGSLDADVLSRIVTRKVCELLGTTVAVVYRLDPESGDLIAMGGSDAETRAEGWSGAAPGRHRAVATGDVATRAADGDRHPGRSAGQPARRALRGPLEVILAHSELLAYDAPGDITQRAEKISRPRSGARGW